MELQKRLPSDRVSGTISLYATSDFQLEGSEVIVPSQVSRHPIHPSLVASMSQDSCFSADEDHAPLIILHADTSQETQAQGDDIIPVVMAMETEAATSPLPSHERLELVSLPPSMERQLSEPLPPSMVRQVLYGCSHLDSKGHASLSRHRSLFDRSHNFSARDSSLRGMALKGIFSGLPQYRMLLGICMGGRPHSL